jgi:3-isopropylmalate dehydrogenase
LPGDGIGPEVCEAARLVLDAAGFEAEYLLGDIGWEFWRTEGDALPARTLDLLRHTDCAFFGAITSKPAAEAVGELAPELQGRGLTYRSPIVRIRQMLDLYICLRPCRTFRGNPLNYRENIDLAIFRENTEGMYIGVEFPKIPEEFLTVAAMRRIPPDAAISIRSITRQASRRIVEAAFQFAVKNGRRKVTAVHKANVLRATCGVFLEAAREVAVNYPQVQFDTANVDAMCMWLLKDPANYDVIVTTNLFGDILSDLGPACTGTIGLAPSGNLNPDRKFPSLFEPVHGSAPDIAGKNIANPIAMIWSAAMMLDFLGNATGKERDAHDAILAAIEATLIEGPHTGDLGGKANTTEVGHAIAARLASV